MKDREFCAAPRSPEPSEADTLTDAEIEAATKKKFGADPPEGAKLAPEDITAAQKKKWADTRMSFALGAFFFTYALFQIPMGTLADRCTTRRVLALSIRRVVVRRVP